MIRSEILALSVILAGSVYATSAAGNLCTVVLTEAAVKKIRGAPFEQLRAIYKTSPVRANNRAYRAAASREGDVVVTVVARATGELNNNAYQGKIEQTTILNLIYHEIFLNELQTRLVPIVDLDRILIYEDGKVLSLRMPKASGTQNQGAIQASIEGATTAATHAANERFERASTSSGF